MGLNLDVDHVAFAATRKFDGQHHRDLTPARAGPDRRPRRPPHERRHVRRHRRGRAVRHDTDRAAGDAQLRQRARRCSGATATSISARSTGCDDSLREMPTRRSASRARVRPTTSWRSKRVSADREIAAMAPRAGRRRAAVGGLPDPRLPQDLAARTTPSSSRTIYKYLMSAEERIPEDWFAKQVGARRPHRRRHRHARQPHRAHPHLDLRLQPCRLAGGSRALAGAHARDRGPPVRRPARAADAALRRPPHQRTDEGHARQGRAARRDRRRRRDQRREPLRRTPEGLPLPARSGRRRHSRQGNAQRRRSGAGARSSACARAASLRRSPTRCRSTAAAASCGARRRSARSRRPTIR